MNTSFTALVVREVENKVFTQTIEQKDISDLPDGDVLIKVAYSSLNYKDALSAIGNPGVSRNFPHSPGIDAVGKVVETNDTNFPVGKEVLVTGYDLGMNTAGGLAQYIRVPASWVVPLPKNLSPLESMSYGTAGFTAALMVNALIDNGVNTQSGEILVTGATGGVGSVAIALLAKAGFNVVAATGKASEADYLKQLGATSVIDRAELGERGKPLQKERWAGVVDAAGSQTLVNACAQTRYGGAVAACGLAQGFDLPGTVMPFILRGVSLLGIDSVMAPKASRLVAWELLARDLDVKVLELIAKDISLSEAVGVATQMMEGTLRGRVVVDVNK